MERPVARAGVATTLFLSRTESGLAQPGWERDDRSGDVPLRTVPYGVPKGRSLTQRITSQFRREFDAALVLPSMLRHDLIQSFTGSLFQSRLWQFVYGRLGMRPYIACATGSDLREVAAGNFGAQGRLMRKFFRCARATLQSAGDQSFSGETSGDNSLHAAATIPVAFGSQNSPALSPEARLRGIIRTRRTTRTVSAEKRSCWSDGHSYRS